MSRHRFLVNGPLAQGETGDLDERQRRQVRSVLRMRTGDTITVFDGSGMEAVARLTGSGATFQIEYVEYPLREPTLRLTVGLALLRGDRFDTAVQKLTEIGVSRIVPLVSDRSVVAIRSESDWERRAERYRRIIYEAAEQSDRVTIPELFSPGRIDEYLATQSTHVLVERAVDNPLVDVPLRRNMAIAIGPEGGWSVRELEIIDEHGSPVTMGKLVLRAETAAIVAAGTLVQRSLTDASLESSSE